MNSFARGAMLIFLFCLPVSQASAYKVLHTSEGAELRWFRNVIPYYINVEGFEDFDQDQLIEVTQRCLQTWTDEDIGISFEFIGVTDVKAAADDNYNVIFFIQDPNIWEETFAGQETALGMTRTWANRSGEILAFDLAFNDDRYDFTNSDDPEQTVTDFANTLTHEIGHVLGLDHSEVPEAVMYSTAPRGELSKRYLSEDDRDGILYLYRPLAEAGCSYRGDDFNEAGGMACRQGGNRSRGSQPTSALMLLALAVIANRVRRKTSCTPIF